MLHCDLRVRWKVASDLRFRAAISEPKTPSFCGISGDLAPSTRKSLAIAIVRFWCAKVARHYTRADLPATVPLSRGNQGATTSLGSEIGIGGGGQNVLRGPRMEGWIRRG